MPNTKSVCWGHDDELVFTHENGRVIISCKCYRSETKKKLMGVLNRNGCFNTITTTEEGVVRCP